MTSFMLAALLHTSLAAEPQVIERSSGRATLAPRLVVAEAALPAPPAPPPVAADCFPGCRAGYFCHQGQCLSACNPPCPSGNQCAEGGQCIAGISSADAPVSMGPTVNDEGERAPRGHHYELKRRRGFLISGPLVLGGGYLVSVLFAVFGYDNNTYLGNGSVVHEDGSYLLYAIPLLGPVVGRGALTSAYGSRLTGAVDWGYSLGMSLAQVVGLTLTLLGSKPTQQLVRDNGEGDEAARSSNASAVRWSLSPGASRAPLGLTLTIEN